MCWCRICIRQWINAGKQWSWGRRWKKTQEGCSCIEVEGVVYEFRMNKKHYVCFLEGGKVNISTSAALNLMPRIKEISLTSTSSHLKGSSVLSFVKFARTNWRNTTTANNDNFYADLWTNWMNFVYIQFWISMGWC